MKANPYMLRLMFTQRPKVDMSIGTSTMAVRWTPNYAPNASASAVLSAWMEATAAGSLPGDSIYELRDFLEAKRGELDLELIDLMELRQFAHQCIRTVSQPEQRALLQSFEHDVANLIMDFGCAIPS